MKETDKQVSDQAATRRIERLEEVLRDFVTTLWMAGRISYQEYSSFTTDLDNLKQPELEGGR